MKRKRPRRLRILYVLLAILIAISVLPLWFYGRTMSQANQQTLKTQEQILQTTIAQSLGQEISLYMANLRQNLSELFDTVLPLASQIDAASFSTDPRLRRSEEHTSELQSPCNLVCRLLLEKKKTKTYTI